MLARARIAFAKTIPPLTAHYQRRLCAVGHRPVSFGPLGLFRK
jgi:hypothetical protein